MPYEAVIDKQRIENNIRHILEIDRITKCDNCGYESIIEKIPNAICPNCNKHKLKQKG